MWLVWLVVGVVGVSRRGETVAEVRVSVVVVVVMVWLVEGGCLEQISCGRSWLVCFGCNLPIIGVQNKETMVA